MISEATLKAWEDRLLTSPPRDMSSKFPAMIATREAVILDLIKEVRELGKALVSEGCVPPAGWGRTRVREGFTLEDTDET